MTAHLIQKLPGHFDVVIVGGGIVGAGIYRDLALHGANVLIVDKKDFASQTSQSSSKMLHGGIRYLENFDFALVSEALHEKNLWLKLAPHLAIEKSFTLPIFKSSKWPPFFMNCGLWLYDALSGFENAPHHMLSKEQTQKKLPQLRQSDLVGSGVYYDSYVNDAKLTLENIFDGSLEKKAYALNHAEVIAHEQTHNDHTLRLRDQITGIEKKVTAAHVIYALGPFTDQILTKLLGPEVWRPRLLPSKGIHLWLKESALTLEGPVVIQSRDGRVIFVNPWPEGIMVGTTESKVTGDFFDIQAEQSEIDYLIKEISNFFPGASLSESDILSHYAGIRPLVKSDETSDLGKTAREHRTFYPLRGVYVIAGGKLTTFRTMGQEISKIVCEDLNLPYSVEKTKRPLRQQSLVPAYQTNKHLSPEKIQAIITSEFVRTADDLFTRRLAVPHANQWYFDMSLETYAKIMLSHSELLQAGLLASS
jgi:glycerol-3-phosphate dehydrogenase